MSAVGRTVRLFLVDGNAQSGLITAEIINWTGRVLVAPRTKIAHVLRRSEAEKTGIYILFGDSVEPGVRRTVYIGESDIVGRRVLQHSKDEQKDFFEKFCIITSSDQNLTKTHVRYLESRVTAMAKESGRANVLNSNEPPTGVLPESDIADMEFFLEQLRIVLPVLGFDILREPATIRAVTAVGPVVELDRPESPIELILQKSREGLEGTAIQLADEIIVQKGTLARKDPDYAMNQYSSLRDQLIVDGALGPSEFGNTLVFSRDVPFSSPSAAAAVIYGRNANGRTAWRIRSTGQTLKDYQNQIADAASVDLELGE